MPDINLNQLTEVKNAGLSLSVCGNVTVVNNGATLTLSNYWGENFSFSIPNELAFTTTSYQGKTVIQRQLIASDGVANIYGIFKYGGSIYCITSLATNQIGVRVYNTSGILQDNFIFPLFPTSVVETATTLDLYNAQINFVNSKGNIGVFFLAGYLSGGNNKAAFRTQVYNISGSIDTSIIPQLLDITFQGGFNYSHILNSNGCTLTLEASDNTAGLNAFTNIAAFGESKTFFRQNNATYKGDVPPWTYFDIFNPVSQSLVNYWRWGTGDFKQAYKLNEFTARLAQKQGNLMTWDGSLASKIQFMDSSYNLNDVIVSNAYNDSGNIITFPDNSSFNRLTSLRGAMGFVLLANSGKFYFVSTNIQTDALALKPATWYSCSNYTKLF